MKEGVLRAVNIRTPSSSDKGMSNKEELILLVLVVDQQEIPRGMNMCFILNSRTGE